jgi:AcrR family transcriptional regulator
MDRKTAILRSANEHFASHGFRGASLRDIARDAQVSLTLLNHHFGSKLDLLRAVIHAHQHLLDDPVSAAREIVRSEGPQLVMAHVIGAWLDIVQRAASDRDGRFFLRLLSRMVDDPQAEASALVRDSVLDAAQVFMDAVRTAHPQATARNAALAYLCVTTAMLRCATAAERLAQLESVDADGGTGDAAAASVEGERRAVAETVTALAGAAEADGVDGAAMASAAGDTAPAEPPAPPPPEREQLLRFLVSGVESLVAA